MESQRPKVRKYLIGGDPDRTSATPGEIDLAADAVLSYTSEHPDHPVENIVDGQDGPHGTRWEAAAADTPQVLSIAFDEPRSIARLHYEVAETTAERTQEIRIEASTDGGQSYRQVLVQEYNFSPRGATFQSEDLTLNLSDVTHLRLTIVPNKQGSGRATLTSVHLFER